MTDLSRMTSDVNKNLDKKVTYNMKEIIEMAQKNKELGKVETIAQVEPEILKILGEYYNGASGGSGAFIVKSKFFDGRDKVNPVEFGINLLEDISKKVQEKLARLITK